MSHIHKYHRVKLGKQKQYTVYKCALPDCAHYVGKELARGRRSICWQCGNDFVLSAYSIRLAKPYCPNCKVEDSETGDRVTEMMKELGLA